jgi:CHAT domain-containing protein
LIFIISLPSNSFAQSADARQITKSDDLFSAVLSIESADQSQALDLLKSKKPLINPYLWHKLIAEAATAGSTSRSLFILDAAKYVAEQLGNKCFLAYTYYRIGAVDSSQGNTSRALQSYLLSKELFEEANASTDLLCVLSELADIHASMGDYQKAEDYSRKSLQLAESINTNKAGLLPYHYGIASALSTLGKVGMWKGDYNAALVNFQRSLSVWKELNREGSLYSAHIVNSLTFIGIIYQWLGDHMQALNHLNQALELAKSLADKERQAAVLANIAVLYIEQCDYAKASDLLNQNLRLFTELNNKREIASTLINMGVINQRLNKNEAALKEFQDGLKVAEEVAALDKVVTAQQGLGTVYYQKGKYPEALEWFDKAWILAQTLGDKIRMTELLWRKGQVYYSLGDYTKASGLADSAADLATKLRLPIMSYLALTLKGKAQRALKEVDLASESFLKSIQEVEHLRGLVAGGEKEQQLFFEDKLTPYHEMLSLLVEQNNSIEALKYAERSKARVLLDVLRNGRVRTNKSLSEQELTEERRLYGDMVSLNAQIRVERMRQQADESRIKELDALLQKARSAYEVLQSTLIAAHPEIKTRSGLLPPFDIKDLSTLVPDARTAVLEYVVTDEQTYLFVMAKDSARQKVEIRIYTVAIKRSDLSALVGEFRKQVANNHPGYRQSGRQLYELLVKPAQQDVVGTTTLCIIPDDLLWELPFQALQTDDGKYLLELSAVYYAPSLQVLSEMKKRAVTLRTSAVSKRTDGRDAAFRPHLYAVGNPAINGELLARAQTVRNTPFVSLPETEKEVKTIKSEVYGPEASSTRVGLAAREDAVKAEMHRYRIIHFATHGVLDDRSPLYSYLLLARGENSSEDGLLEAWELMNMDLKAEMVVLSACDTARGSVGAGEGMIGMTWALFVAGVPTTVASQWKVPSEATTKLMVAFHKNAKKVSKAEAWRQAALEMINDPRYRMKPFYWAGFVLVGYGSG